MFVGHLEGHSYRSGSLIMGVMQCNGDRYKVNIDICQVHTVGHASVSPPIAALCAPQGMDSWTYITYSV